MAENLTPIFDDESGIAIPSMLTDDYISTIDTIYGGGWEYYVGGGVAAFDCNDDGYPELYLTGGENKARLYINQSKLGGPLIFAGAPNGKITVDKAIAAYPIDVDGDGIMDLMTLNHGENILFKGIGDCEFKRANEMWNFNGAPNGVESWSTAFSATWEQGQNWPTLAIGNYIDQDAKGSPWGTCSDNQLFRPSARDDGFDEPQSLTAYCTLSMLFSDWNRSGTQSLRVSNDRQYNKNGREQLWQIMPNKPAIEYTKQQGWKKLNIWGMGIATHDVNADGYPDYFLTSMGDNKLRQSADHGQSPKFKDMAFKLGITAHRPWDGQSVLPSTGWHAQFADVNNDGLIDLFIAKGNVSDMQDFARNDPNNLLLGKPDGTFFEAAGQAGMLSTGRARGALVVDLNLDGLLDIVEVNHGEGLGVWRNLGANSNNIIPDHDDIAQSQKQRSLPFANQQGQAIGNWLALSVTQDDANINAIGGWIEVKADGKLQTKEIIIGGGHASGFQTNHHFGLGRAKNAKVRIIWPDGDTSEWLDINANQFATINKQNSAVTVWLPPDRSKLLQ